MTKIHSGIVLYDIGLDGSHNAVYANEQGRTAGVVFNELIRKQTPDVALIEGDYDCFYFDPRNARRNATVSISRRGTSNVFDVTWTLQGQRTPVFVGVGYQMNPRQFAVHYRTNS